MSDTLPTYEELAAECTRVMIERNAERAKVARLREALGELISYAESVWYDPSNCVDEERDAIDHARAAIRATVGAALRETGDQMTDNPLVEAMAMAIARADGYDMDAHLWRPEAVAALAAIGPGSEAWEGMCRRGAKASDNLDPDCWLIRPNASDDDLAKYVDGLLRAALGFGE